MEHRHLISVLIQIDYSHFCEAEIEDLHPSIRGEKYVSWFEVSVNYPPRMREREPLGNCSRDFESLLPCEPFALDAIEQRLPLEQLHHCKGDPAICSEIKYCQNIWMR